MGSDDGDHRYQRTVGARSRPVGKLQRLLEGEEHIVVALRQPLTVLAAPELPNHVVRRASGIRAWAMASTRRSAGIRDLAFRASSRAGASKEMGHRNRGRRLLNALMGGIGDWRLRPMKRAVQRRDEAIRPIVEVTLVR